MPKTPIFLIKRVGWSVTYIYEHFTFEQEKLKKDFVTGNQKASQKATSSFEKDFFKLLSNSNFEIDCHNNINNCILVPLYDDLNEISYINKFTIIFSDDTFRPFFFSPEHLREEVIQNL